MHVVFWPSARANMPLQSDAPEESDTFQWPVIERDRVGGLADEMGPGKAHDTLIDWCTGREWPVNCMTVISAWWRLNMRGVMVIVTGYGHGDTSSIPGQDWLHFT